MPNHNKPHKASQLTKSLQDVPNDQLQAYINSPERNTLKLNQLFPLAIRKSILTVLFILDSPEVDIQTKAWIAKDLSIKSIPQQIFVEREDRRVDFGELLRMYQEVKQICDTKNTLQNTSPQDVVEVTETKEIVKLPSPGEIE